MELVGVFHGNRCVECGQFFTEGHLGTCCFSAMNGGVMPGEAVMVKTGAGYVVHIREKRPAVKLSGNSLEGKTDAF